MIRREEAMVRLRAFHQADWITRVVARLRKLPAPSITAGHGLLGVDNKGEQLDWSKRNEASIAARTVLRTMTAKDRLALFATLFPQLADDIEAGWQLRAQLPYQAGYSRRGYRAPGDEAAYEGVRYSFVKSVADSLAGYDPDAAWVAAWTPYLGYQADALGLLLAGAISRGNDEVFDILKASATNEHEIGSMGRHVVRGLLAAPRPEGWEFIEKLLLAAQRQEGLRQVILETVDEAQAPAFRRIIALVLEKDLIRFSATVRALDVWFGLQWLALTPAVLRSALERVRLMLDDEAARSQALTEGGGEDFFLALYATAFDDAHKAIPLAVAAVHDENVERRYAAAHLLGNLALPAARAALAGFADDADLRLAILGVASLPDGPEQWDRLIAFVARLPEQARHLEPCIWPWSQVNASRQDHANRLTECLGERPPTDLIPWLQMMGYSGKHKTIELLAKQKKWNDLTRTTLVGMLSDKQQWVRSRAFNAIKDVELTDAELLPLEPLLARKTSDLRRIVTTLLAKRKPPRVLECADRLLLSRKREVRLGGLEIMRLLADRNQAVGQCQHRVEVYYLAHDDLEDAEKACLEAIRDHGKPLPTLDDALGLMDPAQRGAIPAVKERKTACMSKAAVACLKALDALLKEHRTTQVTYKMWNQERTEFVGSLGWNFPSPELDKPLDAQANSLPLAEVWEKWFAERPASQRDRDGCELLRALTWVNVTPEADRQHDEMTNAVWKPAWSRWKNGQPSLDLEFRHLIGHVLGWLVFLHPPGEAAAWCLDTTETMFALVPEKELNRVINEHDWSSRNKSWRNNSIVNSWFALAGMARGRTKRVWSAAQRGRWWQLAAWRDRPTPKASRDRPGVDILLDGLAAGMATEADVYDTLLGAGQSMSELAQFTQHSPPDVVTGHPLLREVTERCRSRVLEVELGRGENPTAASLAALNLSSVHGLDQLVKLLGALGKRPFRQSHGGQGRAEVFTYLVSVCYPLPTDTPEVFVEHVKLSTEKMMELAFLAPQWMRHVAHAIGWTGLREGIWWAMAHTGESGGWGADNSQEVGFDAHKAWQNILAARTHLSEADRSEKRVDPDWFRRAYEPLGRKKWAAILAASKQGPGGAGQTKKVIFLTEVILGKARKADLVKRIKEKQAREAVRLLGLLPLARGDRREADLQGRYRVLMGYRTHARSLSPLGREGAIRDLEIGVANLAATAGYSDPVRLEWAMEAREVADLAAGPVSVSHLGVTVTLALVEGNKPEVTVRRGDKPLKAVPPLVRKNRKVAELTARAGELRKQASRIKQSLETMMVRGDEFTGDELRQLFGHPLLSPLLERLVILGEGIAGYPDNKGRTLRGHAGSQEPVKGNERLRLAHPFDLYTMGDWDKWQSECFRSERVQPFKQVFRELYLVTKQEKEDGKVSSRYAGQQVNPRQSMALFGSRGWGTQDGVSRTWHKAGIVADVSFQHHGWTAAEVEGLTFGTVSFRNRDDWQSLHLDQVPPRLFSETMRDCDLVVSVAHVGGVDPEASASTTEMRSSLVRETCALFGMKNVSVTDRHVAIEGTLGTYSVHLGSGVVHRLPGGSVCIIPVHSQHRGRLFLPFADDDPRTAEVVSKVLLLAKDGEIQDPTILEQLR